MVIVNVIVVYDRRIVVDLGDTGAWQHITMPAIVHEVAVRYKDPEMDGDVDRDVYVQSGHQGSPAVVAATITPVDPSGAPYIIGNPGPAVKVIIEPASVVEWSPAPRIVRYPGVSKFSHHPTAISHVGMKIPWDGWNPDGAIMGVVDPTAVWRKGIIENIKGYSNSGLCIDL